ncbi:calcofluor white hypersensitive protein [Microthyrium microscopicum]|uniref:Calcofluor white hypersensitive protein n=1 Tax=Microthyrium microscopicum TaxID=703497 RepID=A0A6A6U4Z2_9PEZI|nr:calcofluor white hypersensitive protein [Microthyrium microscopicum]
MAPKHRDGDVVASFNGKWITYAHTAVAYAAFLSALIVGCSLHYTKIVQNEYFGYPYEWFPSVSATIGDRYPERSFFMVFIAMTSGPRFALVAMWYFMESRPNSKSSLPAWVAGTGLFRTLSCGGWTYVTSTDDHHWHDIFMVAYLVATVPWTVGCLAISPPNPIALKWRRRFGAGFFIALIPLTYYFLQHKIHHVAGAYTKYALFEWAVVLIDVGFDATTMYDFSGFEIVLRDVKGVTRGSDTQFDAVLEKQKDRDLANVMTTGLSWAAAFDMSADVYLGFTFWTMLTSLGVCVWYFPLWHMGLSGYEVIIMTTIAPSIMAIPSLRTLVARHSYIFHFLSMSGIAAYLVQDPANRLFTVGFAVSMSCLAWAGTFYAEKTQPQRLESRILGFGLGLILSTVAKFAFYTNNPLWAIMHAENGGWNGTGLVLGVLAAIRSTRQSSSRRGDSALSYKPKGSSIFATLGLGAMFFAMHSLLSDSSTMILWVWSGWPANGPLAVPHGAYTITCMGVGLLAGVIAPNFSKSWTFYGIGVTGAAMLTLKEDWTGFYGGLALATYIMGVAPALISSAVLHSPALVFGLGFMIYNLFVLAHVWTTAYAFVPGGPLLREHTDYVMTAMMLCIGAGVYSAQASAISTPSKFSATKASPAAKRSRSYYIYMLIVLEMLAVSTAYLRFPSYDYKPYHPEEKSITAGIWTIHFSIDNDMWSSERRMRDAIRDLELDVVGLLESDLQHIIMGNRDFTQYLAEDLGMYVDFGPGPNKHTWGAALLSKFPIVNSTHHLLPSPVGELAPAIHATLDCYGELVDVFVFHSGQEEDIEDRRLQSEYLSKLMGTVTNRPAILLSYLVTKPKEGNYNNYVSEESGMKDIDSSDWDRWCEYILYKGIKRSGYARVSRGTITDTEIQVGKFVVGQPENGDQMITDGEVPEGLKFPAMFHGEGVRGHQYHVFDAPRYYQ